LDSLTIRIAPIRALKNSLFAPGMRKLLDLKSYFCGGKPLMKLARWKFLLDNSYLVKSA
jgi:hypothetical protein